MINTIIFFIGLILLLYGSYTDIKKREVPDYANYFSIITIIGLRLIDAIYTSEWNIFLQSILWFIGFVILGYIMFYSGQWGGGDSKVLMVMGLVFFSYPEFLLNSFSNLGIHPLIIFPLPTIFLINMIICGAIYGLIWNAVLALKNLKEFIIKWKETINCFSKTRIIISLIALILLLTNFAFNETFVKILLVSVALIIYITFHLLIFTKAVEKSCMFLYMNIKDLTEGEWIANDIFVKKKYICGPKDLGISKKQIEMLKKANIKKVLIKKGIPFVPTFLIAGLVTWLFGNVVFYLMI